MSVLCLSFRLTFYCAFNEMIFFFLFSCCCFSQVVDLQVTTERRCVLLTFAKEISFIFFFSRSPFSFPFLSSNNFDGNPSYSCPLAHRWVLKEYLEYFRKWTHYQFLTDLWFQIHSGTLNNYYPMKMSSNEIRLILHWRRFNKFSFCTLNILENHVEVELHVRHQPIDDFKIDFITFAKKFHTFILITKTNRW